MVTDLVQDMLEYMNGMALFGINRARYDGDNGGDQLGYAVDLNASGNRLVVGAPFNDDDLMQDTLKLSSGMFNLGTNGSQYGRCHV